MNAVDEITTRTSALSVNNSSSTNATSKFVMEKVHSFIYPQTPFKV